MAHITFDRVRETSTTTGSGAFTLSGAVTGFRTFASVAATSDTFYYTIAHYSLTEWEVGLGTYSGVNTLTRTTVIASSNAGAAVVFSAGDKDVFITAPAAKFLQLDNANNVGVGVTPSAWSSSYGAIDLENNGALWTVSPGSVFLTSNAYNNGTNYIYKSTGAASQYQQAAGAHYWSIAASGTGGNTFSFTTAMTLDSASILTVGKQNFNKAGSSASGQLWYSTSYTSWQNYMANATTTTNGVSGTITAPTGSLVTSWGLRSFIENAGGYGWTWESGLSTATSPVIVAELRSSDGTMKIAGDFYARSKSFLIEHPTKPGKQLHYGSLEGPEHAVYVRGKLEGDVIELPDYWTKLVDPETITVQLTAIGSHQKLYVKDIRDNKVYVANHGVFSGKIKCFYYVLAERCDVDKLEVEI